MSKRHKKLPSNQNAKPSTERGFLLVAMAVGAIALSALGIWSTRGGRATGESQDQPANTNSPGVGGEPKAAFAKLLGKWVRPDGGYVVELGGVDGDGKLEAAYFNPNPIHVARAEASSQGSIVKVEIELRDVNYPGSTYTLAYDPSSDSLKGIYYQAVERQQFEVYFQRVQ